MMVKSKNRNDEISLANSIEEITSLENKKPILVIGDCILDCYIEGNTNRLSREAPIPVLDHKAEYFRPGGAANAACNIAAMGCPVILIGVIGNDKSASSLQKELGNYPNLTQKLVVNKSAQTVVKTRFLSQSQQMFRFDIKNEKIVIEKSEAEIIYIIDSLLDSIGAIVLSDYGNGVLTEHVLQHAIKSAKKKKILSIVDPRAFDMKCYEGADFITPNEEELKNSYGSSVLEDSSVATAAKKLIKKYSFQGVLATRGAKGLTLVQNNEVIHVAADKRKVFDVTGAGDCVLAWFTLACYAGMPFRQSAMLANLAGGLAVETVGVAVLTINDLQKVLQYPDKRHSYKIYNTDSLISQINIWKQKKYTIGLTNGCFDILHAGHISQISFVASNCDRLIIAINSDTSVSKLKGISRPLQNQLHRSQILSAFSDVDAVIIFDEIDVCTLIKKIQPDIYIKGADYNLDTLEEAVLVRSLGGKCISAPLVEGLSSSNIIKKIKDSN